MPNDTRKYVDYEGLKHFKSKLDSKFTDLHDYIDDAVQDVEASGTIVGYYYHGAFYSDSSHTDLLEGKEGLLYVDKGTSNKLYMYNGSSYEIVSDSGSAVISLGETTVDCGGITKGTDLSGKSLQQVLEMLLTSYVPPKEVFLTASTSEYGYIEQNSTNTIETLRVRWVPGTVPVQTITISGDASMTLTPQAGETSIIADITDINFTTETKRFTATLNIPGHDGVQASCEVSNNYDYPVYYGAVNKVSSQLTGNDIQSATKIMPSVNQTYSYTMTDSYPMVASTRRLTRVTDSSEVTDYTNAFIGSETEISLSSVNPSWGPVTYYVYTGSKVTLSNFSFKFIFSN